ncbi:mevalonate kinase [bacterium]|nr:mevalonate kinase [bacterium]OIO87912.1 MAG: mevalonate kinase [Anaerolineae bacterium CG2_30_58_95]PIU90974.1 MAG: mevalonate kinase [Anaerolineae bacterium CG06_land_8_20_14_3_00_57_67]PIW18182.1 MAG: mevalonate kinase [Anaerolineae bacterium CG17_big_fil_post_rev_8_21_14_2_50_57_27]PIX47925.1 MAG: mevalonate kinase [Anaerolineae bacterium CG_4_8_14_3_um_filter_59_70]PIZ25761.1 MAG: mevalonate kinase [Chloroflexi bacterium CG_4_10_14_0_8_um_filter_57_5]PJH74486.1 MAG: mevalonate kinase [
MAKGTGFGKTILIGDQFVLEEVPAIVSAISFETVTTVERIAGDGWILEDNRIEVPGYKEKKKEQQARSIDRILEVMNIDVKKNPIKITVGGTLLAGSGVGASAASCVSLARALNAEFKLGLPIEEINRVAWQGEFPYHGVASGVDNTASTYGGLLLFQLIKGQQHFEKIKTPKAFEIVLANSGITANTALLDEFSERQKKENPDLFASRMKTITSQGQDMKKALEAGDLRTVGTIMSNNHKLLAEMEYSHEILDKMCKSALERGAWGAKVTGGGRGGYMVSLTPGKELQDKVASAFDKEGYKVIRATIGGS